MEQRVKLAAVYLGMYFIFMAVARVPSETVFHPDLIIDRITESVHELKEQIKHASHIPLLRGPAKKEWESENECAGTFLDIFVKGTRNISLHLHGNKAVNSTSQTIINCVHKLKRENGCEQLEHTCPLCNMNTHGMTAKYFVKMFHEFSDHKLWEICGLTSNPTFDHREYNKMPTGVPIC